MASHETPGKSQESETVQSLKKAHTVTVCAVPPPENVDVWKALKEMRCDLKDPGYYRWPPHVNLLYPFLELPTETGDGNHTLTGIVERLDSATRNLSPFRMRLNHLGTFGGKRKGVLWLHPDSGEDEPLLRLQESLEQAFPTCNDQSRIGGCFTPHMTLSHYPNLETALQAKEAVETTSPYIGKNTEHDEGNPCLEFVLDRVYLLKREGDEGQFLRIADIALGTKSRDAPNKLETQTFNPPQPFPGMPIEEDEWVYEERMALKSRRKNNRKSRRKSRRGNGEK